MKDRFSIYNKSHKNTHFPQQLYLTKSVIVHKTLVSGILITVLFTKSKHWKQIGYAALIKRITSLYTDNTFYNRDKWLEIVNKCMCVPCFDKQLSGLHSVSGTLLETVEEISDTPQKNFQGRLFCFISTAGAVRVSHGKDCAHKRFVYGKVPEWRDKEAKEMRQSGETEGRQQMVLGNEERRLEGTVGSRAYSSEVWRDNDGKTTELRSHSQSHQKPKSLPQRSARTEVKRKETAHFKSGSETKKSGGRPLERRVEKKGSGVLQAGRDLANMLVRRSEKRGS